MSSISHPDYREKKEDNSRWYFYAFLSGIGIFLIFLIVTKGLIFVVTFVVKVAKDYTFYFGVGALILLILIRKLRKNKRKKEVRKYEYSY